MPIAQCLAEPATLPAAAYRRMFTDITDDRRIPRSGTQAFALACLHAVKWMQLPPIVHYKYRRHYSSIASVIMPAELKTASYHYNGLIMRLFRPILLANKYIMHASLSA